VTIDGSASESRSYFCASPTIKPRIHEATPSASIEIPPTTRVAKRTTTSGLSSIRIRILLTILSAGSFIASQNGCRSQKSKGSSARQGDRRSSPTRADSTTQVQRFKAHGPGNSNPVVRIKTSMGQFWMELLPEKAPLSVRRFLKLVWTKQYDGTIFHRAIPGFLIQGGGWDPHMRRRPSGAPLLDESDNGLHNLRGTVAMARLDLEPDSGTGQFFINLADNLNLDFRGHHPLARGYAVFARILSGMEVVDRIAAVRTCRRKPFASDVPCTPVVIEHITRVR